MEDSKAACEGRSGGFIAGNAQSLIEAYLTLSVGGKVFPFGVYDDDTPVGFVMIGCGVDETFEDPAKIAYDSYSIWRFMTGSDFQHRGYGREAFLQALEFIRTKPCGEAEYCYLSYEPENTSAAALYRSVGFTENGEKDGDEIAAVLQL